MQRHFKGNVTFLATLACTNPPTRATARGWTNTRGSRTCRGHPRLHLFSRSCAARRGVALHQECAGRWSEGPAMSALDPLATSVNARGSLQRSKKYASAARTPALSSHRFLTWQPPRLPLQPTTSRSSGTAWHAGRRAVSSTQQNGARTALGASGQTIFL